MHVIYNNIYIDITKLYLFAVLCFDLTLSLRDLVHTVCADFRPKTDLTWPEICLVAQILLWTRSRRERVNCKIWMKIDN